MKKSLSSLLCALDEKQVTRNASVQVSGITSDSRRVTPGMLFVAVDGNHENGSEYIGEAMDRGASAIVGKSSELSGKQCFIQVPNPRLALSRLAAAWYDHPSRDLEIVGITGTNGKTSVSFMLRHIIASHNEACGLIGTVRYEIGSRQIPAARTTPDAVELQRLLHGMQKAGCKKVVMEVSSHSIDQHRVADVGFDWAAFTNLSRDHLDYHRSMESYFKTKRRLFEKVAISGKGMLIHADDSYGRRLASGFDSAPISVMRYGMITGDLSASDLRQHESSMSFKLSFSQTSIEVQLPMLGIHNVQNALAAVGLGILLGYPIESIVRALKNLPPIAGRLERIDQGQPFSVYVDYAHTADALRRVLQTLRRSASGRLLLLFGCGGGRDEGKRRSMGRIAARLSDRFWITNDNPRQEDPRRIVNQILSGIQNERAKSLRVEYDRKRAIAGVLSEAAPGDVVLIAGKGHETYQEIDGAVIPFDDRFYAQKALENAGYLAMSLAS